MESFRRFLTVPYCSYPSIPVRFRLYLCCLCYLRVYLRLVPILLLTLVVVFPPFRGINGVLPWHRPAVGPRLLIRQVQAYILTLKRLVVIPHAYIAANFFRERPIHYPPLVDASGSSTALPPKPVQFA